MFQGKYKSEIQEEGGESAPPGQEELVLGLGCVKGQGPLRQAGWECGYGHLPSQVGRDRATKILLGHTKDADIYSENWGNPL